MKIKELIIGICLFALGQTLAWYQTNGQFLSKWAKEHPLLISAIVGIPIGIAYIYGTTFIVGAFEGKLWPARIVGFTSGIFTFTLLTYVHMNQGITLKTAIMLSLASIIIMIQIFWKE